MEFIKMFSVCDKLSEVTDRAAAYSADVLNGQTLSFYADHILNINKMLIMKGKTAELAATRYPCVIVLCDFLETHTAGQVEVKLQVLIATETPDVSKGRRERENTVFKPVLWPLAENFIRAINSTAGVSIKKGAKLNVSNRYELIDSLSEALKRMKVDVPIFNDRVDAVEFRDLNLIMLEPC